MPQFGPKGELLTVSYITGPCHLWLGLKFSPQPIDKPAVVKQPPSRDCFHGEVEERLLVEAVMAGSQGYGLYPVRIEYVENDSPRYDIYAHCAQLLAKRAAEGEA